MKWFFIFKHSLYRQWRDKLVLLLTLLTAPFFVLLYWLLFGNQSVQPMGIIVFDSSAVHISGGQSGMTVRGLTTELEDILQEANSVKPKIVYTQSIKQLNHRLLSGDFSIGLVLMESNKSPDSLNKETIIEVYGNASTFEYQLVNLGLKMALEKSMNQFSGFTSPVRIQQKPLGLSGSRTPFEMYVPGLIVFAVIMLIFSSSMAVTREVETGTLVRLAMTRASAFDIMVGISSAQLVPGFLSVALTYIAAMALGFHNAGSLVFALVLVAAACLSNVGIGMIVASLSKNLLVSFLLSSVFMFLLILFSGIIFPRPDISWISIAGRSIGPFDILPTTHLGKGLEKILTLGASLNEIKYELSILLISSLVFFSIGLLIFRKTCLSFFNR